MPENIPTYIPGDTDTDVPFDWERYYEGEDSSVSASRIVTQGHSIVDTSWPHKEPLEEQVSEQVK